MQCLSYIKKQNAGYAMRLVMNNGYFVKRSKCVNELSSALDRYSPLRYNLTL